MRIYILILLILFAAPLQAQRLELSKSLEKVASSASERVEVDLDASMLNFASKILSDSNPEELAAKNLIAGLKGIYVRKFTSGSDHELNRADLQLLRDQLTSPEWSRSFMTSAPGITMKIDDGSRTFHVFHGTVIALGDQTEVWMYREYSEMARKKQNSGEAPASGPDKVGGMLVLSSSAHEITVVNIVGPIRPEDFVALGGRFGIPRIQLPPKREPQQ